MPDYETGALPDEHCRRVELSVTVEVKSTVRLTRTTSVACKQCDKPTANPAFCSSSCAARFNNARRSNPAVPRKERQCAKCGIDITTLGKRGRRTLCDVCLGPNWGTITMGEFRRRTHFRSRMCQLARQSYRSTNRPARCFCGYDKTFDVAHIKSVEDWPDDATVAAVNHPSNLIALCKNHHWEFDHNVL